MANKANLIQQIEHTLAFLEGVLPLANVHMVDYFNKNVFLDSTYISEDIRQECLSNGIKNTINTIFEQKTNHMQHLHQFISKSRALTLKNTLLCLSLNEFTDKLKLLGSDDISNIKLDIFMSSKKSHEVEILSGVAAAIQNVSKTTHLIDIGDGKGYLSSMLALNYKIPILGIDASQVNTDGAVNRANKLSKVWNGVVTNTKSRETSIDLYKQITKYVDLDVNLSQLVSNIFLEKPLGPISLGLVGLHTCGNLAPTCLKLFSQKSDIKTICNVGCCYHHLTEYPKNRNSGQDLNIGFPLSQFLTNKQCHIGRGARMIAAQSVERILSKKERPSKTIFYRSLLEVLINQKAKNCKNREVGRFRKPCENFVEYVRKASARINLDLGMTDEQINAFYIKYQHRMDEMDLFYLLRALVAPVVETLILLDRLLFLVEQGFEKSFVVYLFDAAISPRCYGIVAIKS
ncbi:probable methyltransferase-like protein 25 [Anthonomus grandis grandis]|uniref:probable methyltransferase-like protein 25 n=1 Tax=Anthonomus grandis grandis TaxID=2921223 RepID=UPI0021650B6D|nr:probable methyltransferase-like protein 25 [Anthonomus grandis grandis]